MSLAMAKLRAALAGAGSDFWLRDARAPAERRERREGLREALLGRGMGLVTIGSFVETH